MPEFRYIARNELGAKIEGVIDAGNENEAAAALSADGMFPLEVKPLLRQTTTGRARRVGGQLLAQFYSQLLPICSGAACRFCVR